MNRESSLKYLMLTIIYVVASLFFTNVSFAALPPGMPCDFYGYEEWPDILHIGDEIVAKDPDGVIRGSYTVTANGQYGFLSCSADDPATVDVDEGAVEGDIITLFLNGAEVVNKGTWAEAGTVRIDIGDVIEVEEVSIDIHRAFNQICFSVMPQNLPTPYMASQLIQDMAAQGITVDVVQQWDWSIWVSHQYDLPFTDFELNLDEGIFIRIVSDTYHAGTWTIQGERIDLPKTVNLHHGWNLIAIPSTISVNTAIETLQQINSQGGTADVMMYWDGGIWVSTQVGLPFTDQNFVKGRSYFIRCEDASTWQMQ